MFLAAIYLMLLLGLAGSGAFFLIHRPTRFWSSRTLNSTGWVALVFVLYLRNLVLLAWSGGTSYSDGQAARDIFGLVSGYAVDALVVWRLLSFIRYKRAFEAEEARQDAEAENARRDAESDRLG